MVTERFQVKARLTTRPEVLTARPGKIPWLGDNQINNSLQLWEQHSEPTWTNIWSNIDQHSPPRTINMAGVCLGKFPCLVWLYLPFLWYITLPKMNKGHLKKGTLRRTSSNHHGFQGYVTLPETYSKFAPENGWLEDEFTFGFRHIFRCELLVLGRVVFGGVAVFHLSLIVGVKKI